MGIPLLLREPVGPKWPEAPVRPMGCSSQWDAESFAEAKRAPAEVAVDLFCPLVDGTLCQCQVGGPLAKRFKNSRHQHHIRWLTGAQDWCHVRILRQLIRPINPAKQPRLKPFAFCGPLCHIQKRPKPCCWSLSEALPLELQFQTSCRCPVSQFFAKLSVTCLCRPGNLSTKLA